MINIVSINHIATSKIPIISPAVVSPLFSALFIPIITQTITTIPKIKPQQIPNIAKTNEIIP